MRTLFDHLAKEAFEVLLSDTGSVHREMEIVSNPQKADTVFVPDAAARAVLMERGLLGRMVECPCILEAFHNAPSSAEVQDCIRKFFIWRHGITPPADTKAKVPILRLWLVCAGTPLRAMRTFRLRKLRYWPTGVYAIAPNGIGLYLVAIPELPKERSTLALRLLGRGSVLREALDELKQLPDTAWERRMFPILVSWHLVIESKREHSPDEEDFMTAARDLLKQMEQQWIEKGIQQGTERGIEKGIDKALAPLIHLFERKLGRTLSASDRATLVERLDRVGPDRLGDVVLDLPAEQLAAWLADPDAR
jgi:hypothetical protein